jgi:hypothetical protein
MIMIVLIVLEFPIQLLTYVPLSRSAEEETY